MSSTVALQKPEAYGERQPEASYNGPHCYFGNSILFRTSRQWHKALCKALCHGRRLVKLVKYFIKGTFKPASQDIGEGCRHFWWWGEALQTLQA